MKKVFIIIILSFMFLGIFNLVWAEEGGYPTMVEDYPELPACQGDQPCKPGDQGFGLPQFINYIFIFSLGIVGIVGIIAIIIGGLGYVTAVGNPQKAGDAKSRILSALLGIILLLGSYVILDTINPNLTKLKMPTGTGEAVFTPESPEKYSCYCCCSNYIDQCDPFAKDEYKRWTAEFSSKSKALEECTKNCEFYICTWSNVTGWSADVKKETSD